jgi:hypothetical protein
MDKHEKISSLKNINLLTYRDFVRRKFSDEEYRFHFCIISLVASIEPMTYYSSLILALFFSAVGAHPGECFPFHVGVIRN